MKKILLLLVFAMLFVSCKKKDNASKTSTGPGKMVQQKIEKFNLTIDKPENYLFENDEEDEVAFASGPKFENSLSIEIAESYDATTLKEAEKDLKEYNTNKISDLKSEKRGEGYVLTWKESEGSSTLYQTKAYVKKDGKGYILDGLSLNEKDWEIIKNMVSSVK